MDRLNYQFITTPHHAGFFSMKKITFVRHYALCKPYNEYGKLSLSTLHAIAINMLDPKIAKNSLLSEYHTKPEVILTSPSLRARQTARQINDSNIVIENNLKEVMFYPKQLTSEYLFKKYGMSILRERINQALEENSLFVESLISILQRLSSLEQTFNTIPSKNIICISHGFFMRFAYSYFHNSRAISARDLRNKSIPSFSHGDVFTISLN